MKRGECGILNMRGGKCVQNQRDARKGLLRPIDAADCGVRDGKKNVK
jgi:hypothetical protein